MQVETLSVVLDRIYDAALAPASWKDALAAICRATESAAGTLASVDLASGCENTLVNVGIDPAWDDLYKERYHCTDLFIHPLMLKDVGEPAISTDLVADSELLDSRIYKEWAAPQGFRDTLLTMLGRNQARLAILGLTRRLEQPRYGAMDRERLRLIVPHMIRALKIAELLEQQTYERSVFVDVVDAVNVAVFIVDEDGRVRHRNPAADEILDTGATIKLSGGVLYTMNGVRLSISGVARTIDAGAGDGFVALPLPVRSGEPPRRFALFCKPVEFAGPLAFEVWGRRFGLTGGELRVLAGLVDGRTPNEVAELYGLRSTTVKTHLRSLFRKTGTRRQSELLKAALAAVPPAIPQSDRAFTNGRIASVASE